MISVSERNTLTYKLSKNDGFCYSPLGHIIIYCSLVYLVVVVIAGICTSYKIKLFNIAL